MELERMSTQSLDQNRFEAKYTKSKSKIMTTNRAFFDCFSLNAAAQSHKM